MTVIGTTAGPRSTTDPFRRTLPRHADRRGTRGFAAFVVGLAGFVVLGIGAVVLPSTTTSTAWPCPG